MPKTSHLHLLAALLIAAGYQPKSVSQTTFTRICSIAFDQDAKRPARVENQALPCLRKGERALAQQPDSLLYLVATADRTKDNEHGHGKERVEQDMSGEDLRYADVAAYRAVNTKAYMVQWMHLKAGQIVPLTTYEDGQWLEIDIAPPHLDFKAAYPKPIAPILVRPCTVKPCPSGDEEFLIAQPRQAIPEPSRSLVQEQIKEQH